MVEPKDSGQITYSKIDKAITALKDLKPKERDSVSDRDAVRKMRRYIEKLTSDKYGYSYDEVSEMLKGLGINLSGSRIKYLLGEIRKNTRRHQKKNQGETTTTEQVLIESQSEPQSEPVDTASEQNTSETHSKPAADSSRGKRKNLSLVNQQHNNQATPSARTDTST